MSVPFTNNINQLMLYFFRLAMAFVLHTCFVLTLGVPTSQNIFFPFDLSSIFVCEIMEHNLLSELWKLSIQKIIMI